MSDRETTAAMQAALMKSYPLPEYATFFEVGDATGGRHSRWADAVSMACWPSRGLRIWGFELKASRSDWLREKKKPEKSCAVQRFCNHWVLVTAPDVILPGELPPTWGHMILKGNKLHWEAKAPDLTPDPLEPSFVAALLRRCGQTSAEMMSKAVQDATQEARERGKEEVRRAVERQSSGRAEAVAAIEKFKDETGIDLMSFTSHGIGKDILEYRAAKADVSRSFGWNTSAKSLREAADAIEKAEAAVRAANLLTKETA